MQSGEGGDLLGSYIKNTRRLHKEDINALPLVHMANLNEKHDCECLLCFMDFELEETLRLLPACKHVFHQEGIDTGIGCASLVEGDAEKIPAPGGGIQVVETIAEVEENRDYSDS